MQSGQSALRFWAGWFAQACGLALLLMSVTLLGLPAGAGALVLVVTFAGAVALVARAVGWATSRRP